MKRQKLPQKTEPRTKFPKKITESEAQKKKQQGTEPKKRKRRRAGTGSGKQSQATPYDDVFRTLLNDCTPMILPIVNEMFGTDYTGDEAVEFHPNQHFINQQNGKEEKRITDSSFTVISTVPKHYLLELQSSPDSSMLVRIFEYSTQIALDSGELTNNTLHVTIPNCGILFLRSTRNTPERMQIELETPGGSTAFYVQVLKTQKYTIQ
ncbi:MAG: hypothetical protein LUE16_04175 [Lachnospiraceae bacterium]|nr:hypothetical protein [Lachnospiraceae bacterium]